MTGIEKVIFEAACRLFDGDAESARLWLIKPQVAFGGLSLMQVSLEDALNFIGRLEHGVVN